MGRPRRPGGRRSFNPAMKRTSTRWGIRAEPKVPGCRTYRSCPRERRRASVPLSGERATRLEPDSQVGTCRRSLGDVEIPPRRAVGAAGGGAPGGGGGGGGGPRGRVAGGRGGGGRGGEGGARGGGGPPPAMTILSRGSVLAGAASSR